MFINHFGDQFIICAFTCPNSISQYFKSNDERNNTSNSSQLVKPFKWV
jgi:hypothetical protein